jgi:phenylalanyl-tRNA synthetase beta chain
MADELPPQRDDPGLEQEERLRDLLVDLGLQEVVTYRMTSPERERRLILPGAPPDDRPYVRIANPIASDRHVLRHSLLSSLLEVVERNARLRPRQALFEIGPVFFASEAGDLPDELPRLALILTGPRAPLGWQEGDAGAMDFYDLKGVLEALFNSLRLGDARYEEAEHPSFHPGKCARVYLGERQVGVLGELHPLVRLRYELPEAPVLAADLNLQVLLGAIPARYTVEPVPAYPPVLEDLAVVLDEELPAGRVTELIQQAGGNTLAAVNLFDVYRGEQVGPGKKSLAYSLTYQSAERTLTDAEVLKIRQRILRRLEQDLGARLRS